MRFLRWVAAVVASAITARVLTSLGVFVPLAEAAMVSVLLMAAWPEVKKAPTGRWYSVTSFGDYAGFVIATNFLIAAFRIW